MEGFTNLIISAAEMHRILQLHLDKTIVDGAKHEVNIVSQNKSTGKFEIELKKSGEKK